MTATAGLLKRAAAIRTLRREASVAGASGFGDRDAESGITAEERREISLALEEVSRSNRLAEGLPTTLVARKRGVLLPVIVNLSALVVTALVLLFLARAFSATDQAAVAQTVGLASAEGRLLGELKRESDARLKEKDKAIAEIQAKMQAIDKDRNDLVATMDQRIKTREAELQAQLQDELRKERERLLAQGLSEAVIQARLKVFEDQKSREFQQQLGAYKNQAAAELAAADKNYQKLKDEYSRNMSALGVERKKILDDAKAREDQLRATMDAKTKELEAQGAAAQAALAKAKADLARLQDQGNAAQAAEDRIVGFYASIKQAFQDRRFDEAARSADALAAYLNDPSVAGLASLQSRRPMDLFAAQTLADEARAQLSESSADTGKLLDQAKLLGEARAAATAADAARKAGDTATADAKYGEALAKVPEILAAHQWFMQKAVDEEAARRGRLDRSVATADAAWKAGDGASALAAYVEALSYLPLSEASRSRILQRVGQISVAEADRRRAEASLAATAADSKSAKAALEAASRALAAGRYDEALGSYLDVLAQWPKADGAPQALQGIQAAGRGLDQALASLSDQATRESAAAAEKNASLAASLAKAVADRDSAMAKNSQLEQKLADLQARVDQMAKMDADLAKRLPAIRPLAVSSARNLDVDALEKQVAELKALTKEWRGVSDAYGGFEKEADAAGGDVTAELAALRAFLSDDRVRSALGRLGESFDLVLSGWGGQAGSDAVHNAAFIAVQAASMRDAAARDRYLAGQAGVFASDELVSGFIAALRDAWK